jgi:hypothetical protein
VPPPSPDMCFVPRQQCKQRAPYMHASALTTVSSLCTRRAPVMVAIALIESGMTAEDAVLMIREVRRGAINSK